MTVTDCLIGSKAVTVNKAVEIVEHDSKFSDSNVSVSSIIQLAEISSLCNAGEFDPTTLNLPLKHRKIFGDATDQAILRFSESIYPVSHARTNWRIIHRIPFSSKNKFMIHVVQLSKCLQNQASKSTGHVMTIKGAPDVLLPRCSHFLASNGIPSILTHDQRCFIEETKNNWSTQAKRVILVARKNLGQWLSCFPTDSNEYDDEIIRQSNSGLEIIGLLAIFDPPREEIPEVIRILRGAGVKVHMVTGDFKLTATAIAKDCGIITKKADGIDDVTALFVPEKVAVSNEEIRSIVISGSDMKLLGEEQWDILCKYDEIVFARTTPDQKLRIVTELQKRDEVVGSKFIIILSNIAKLYSDR
jgi:sodium/potassium-transporting ATPase subunit alpha